MFNECSTTDMNVDTLMDRMRFMQASMRSVPTRIVMTSKTFAALKESCKPLDAVSYPQDKLSPIYGIPIEHYETIRECLDRMSNARKGERLLLAITEEIPSDCIDHPFMIEEARRYWKKLY